MSYEHILTATADNILTITINRPAKLNALNQALLAEIKAAFEKEAMAADVYGVILTGSGDKAFAAGADIGEFQKFSPEDGKKFAANGHAVMAKIERFGKPVIAAVNGFALGGGCELAMACHMIVASVDARFGQPEVNLGIIPGYGGTQRLTQRIGRSKATELMMTGDMISGEYAAQLGLANYVVPAELLLDKSREILQKIARKSPNAITQVVKAINAHYDACVDGFKAEVEAFGDCCGTDEFAEGTAAFLEKRKAKFRA